MITLFNGFKIVGIYALNALLIIIGYLIYINEKNEVLLMLSVLSAFIVILTEMNIRYQTRTKR